MERPYLVQRNTTKGQGLDIIRRSVRLDGNLNHQDGIRSHTDRVGEGRAGGSSRKGGRRIKSQTARRRGRTWSRRCAAGWRRGQGRGTTALGTAGDTLDLGESGGRDSLTGGGRSTRLSPIGNGPIVGQPIGTGSDGHGSGCAREEDITTTTTAARTVGVRGKNVVISTTPTIGFGIQTGKPSAVGRDDHDASTSSATATTRITGYLSSRPVGGNDSRATHRPGPDQNNAATLTAGRIGRRIAVTVVTIARAAATAHHNGSRGGGKDRSAFPSKGSVRGPSIPPQTPGASITATATTRIVIIVCPVIVVIAATAGISRSATA